MTVIDCNTCPVRGQHCQDCFVPLVGGARRHDLLPDPMADPSADLPLSDAEWDAIDVFVGAGLINALDVLDVVARPERSSAMPGGLRVG